MDLLPKNWECVQLIRMRKNLDNIHINPKWKKEQEDEITLMAMGSEKKFTLQYKLINRFIITSNTGGGVFMLKRNYVKKLLDYYIRGDNEYFLDVRTINGESVFPFPEICVIGLGTSYNIPLFVENVDLATTYLNADMKGESWQTVHINSREFYVNFWKNNSRKLGIHKLMYNKNIIYS
jgi:hypothetical protein